MRQYAWYSPELNVIVLQSIMEDCYIVFEWDNCDLYLQFNGNFDDDPMGRSLWIPLGEL
jgi:hypothetical protein